VDVERLRQLAQSSALDREPQPSDGPDYHAEHAAWVRRQEPVDIADLRWYYGPDRMQFDPDVLALCSEVERLRLASEARSVQ
jgi:hypothetical protein